MNDETREMPETPESDVDSQVDAVDAAVAADLPADADEAEIVDEAPALFTAADLGLDLPADPAEREQQLLHELAVARSEASEYLDTLQRVAAEFDNYRKRVERDQSETVLRASQRLVESMLPTLDAFDAALGYDAQTPAEEKIVAGMRGTHTQLMDTLQREGFAAIEAEGTDFDPAVHEAVAGGGDGHLVVAQELRKGYTLQGRVIRPTLVMVEEAS
ncbi:MAG TPA: nucleotide exchange factor GrpE [Acidimicrobiia bacterium]|jgi:molecular chaperone GrpE|nr:nucleotide exchange factor GrpE [Acidimicrobiia bacterium]